MAFHDIPVQPLTQQDIETLAQRWVKFATKTCGEKLNLVSLCAAANVQIVPRPDAKMGDNLALADPQRLEILIRASVFRSAEDDYPDARMVLAHELGHIALHRGAEQKARKAHGNDELKFIPIEQSAEAQAWKFARALTMPLHLAQSSETAEQLARLCNVPIEQAKLRLQEICVRKEKRGTPAFVQPLFTSSQSRADAAEAKKAKYAREILRVWNSAPRVPRDPTNSRLCHRHKWRVLFSEFNKMTECGWVIRDGKIVAWKDLEG